MTTAFGASGLWRGALIMLVFGALVFALIDANGVGDLNAGSEIGFAQPVTVPVKHSYEQKKKLKV